MLQRPEQQLPLGA
ncbi:hypothetical protein VCHC41A1_2519, partial [Vibrio cholerae HC-41A1]